MPANIPSWLRFLAWLAALGLAVLLTSKLVGKVQGNAGRFTG